MRLEFVSNMMIWEGNHLNITKNNGLEFLEFIITEEEDIFKYHRIAGSFSVIKCEDKCLLCYNIWRKQWELQLVVGKAMKHQKNVQ